jgi:type III pantothenate kinase
MHRHLATHCGEPPQMVVTGGAGWKVAPYIDLPHELIESLIFDGLLHIQSHRLAL